MECGPVGEGLQVVLLRLLPCCRRCDLGFQRLVWDSLSSSSQDYASAAPPESMSKALTPKTLQGADTSAGLQRFLHLRRGHLGGVKGGGQGVFPIVLPLFLFIVRVFHKVMYSALQNRHGIKMHITVAIFRVVGFLKLELHVILGNLAKLVPRESVQWSYPSSGRIPGFHKLQLL